MRTRLSAIVVPGVALAVLILGKGPTAAPMSSFFRFLPGIDTGEYHNYFHTDLETPQTVPWTGLEASTRAYAKIIDEVNKLPLRTFQRPEQSARTSASGGR